MSKKDIDKEIKNLERKSEDLKRCCELTVNITNLNQLSKKELKEYCVKKYGEEDWEFMYLYYCLPPALQPKMLLLVQTMYPQYFSDEHLILNELKNATTDHLLKELRRRGYKITIK